MGVCFSHKCGSCEICTENINISKLKKICGNNNCSVMACNTCINNWYGRVKVGCLIFEPHTKCPFCMQIPTINFLIETKSDIIKLQNLQNLQNSISLPKFNKKSEICNWNKDFYYGVCDECFNIEIHSEKICGNNDILDILSNIKNWKCNECNEYCERRKNTHIRNAIEYTAKVKQCPNCSIDTELIDSYNSATQYEIKIKCIYPSCNCEWCWKCTNKQIDCKCNKQCKICYKRKLKPNYKICKCNKICKCATNSYYWTHHRSRPKKNEFNYYCSNCRNCSIINTVHIDNTCIC